MINIRGQFSVARKLLRKRKADETNNSHRNQNNGKLKVSVALRNADGAIDMASIMIGVLAIGAIGAVIATTVFVVIPWAQDESAKNQLKSLMNAQQAYAGMKATEPVSGQQIGSLFALRHMQMDVSATPDNESYAYGDLTDLIEADLFDPYFLPPDADDEIYGEQMLSPDMSMCVIKLETGKGYEAAIRSNSGNVFVTNDGWLGPAKVPETSPVCLGRVLGEYENSEDVVIIPPVVIPIEEMNPAPPVYVEEPEEPIPSETPGDGSVGGVNESAEPTPEPSDEPETEETDEPDEIIEPTPSESPSSPTPAPSSTPTSSPTPSPSKPPVTPETAPEPPAANKDPKTKKFMFCHHGAMHSNAFNGMVNGHHGHEEDIMPPIPFKNYVGWNWNAETAKIYYNNCKPL